MTTAARTLRRAITSNSYVDRVLDKPKPKSKWQKMIERRDILAKAKKLNAPKLSKSKIKKEETNV